MKGVRIHKILNNNVAVVLEAAEPEAGLTADREPRECIVMGRGICFKKKPGDEISPQSVDKMFSLSTPETNTKFQILLKDVPMEHIVIGEEIISKAKTDLGKDLNDMVYLSLIDHVHTSILRFLDGITVKNVLLWDIRRFYKEEFQVGLWALGRIEEELNIRLPEDEAGFIALHLVNAQMDQETMHNMYEITTVMQEVVNLVKYYFHVDLDEDDVYYYRFITHLKFFAKRLAEHNSYRDDGDDGLWAVIKERYPKVFGCVETITRFIEKKYSYDLSKEEQLYLTIHIERVMSRAVR